jgi:hypothetical protein
MKKHILAVITTLILTGSFVLGQGNPLQISVGEVSNDIFVKDQDGNPTTSSMDLQVGFFQSIGDGSIGSSSLTDLYLDWVPFGDGSGALSFNLEQGGAVGADNFFDTKSGLSVSPKSGIDLDGENVYLWASSGAFPAIGDPFNNAGNLIIKSSELFKPGTTTTGGAQDGVMTILFASDIADPQGSTLLGTATVADGVTTYQMIPEPSAFTLLLGALGMLMLFRRRRRA